MSREPHFETYGRNRTDSGVSQFAITDDGSIHVRFHDDRVYVYGPTRPGVEHVTQMIRLARSGTGLATYISQHVHNAYERKYTAPTGRSS